MIERSKMLIMAGILASIIITAESAYALTLTDISTGFNNPIGIDHYEPTNEVIMSVHYSSGQPYNFELVASDGSRTQFSSINGLTNEIKIASVREGACQGGFNSGELFTGTGVGGVIARISPDGSTIQNPWVTLPNENGLMRGSLFQDRYCSFDGDLIVVTTAGNVWRVTSSGIPTKLASIGTHLEGVTTVPNDPQKYGPWAGKILAGAELQSRVYAIDSQGNVEYYELGIKPEDIDIIPDNENFYGVDFGSKKLVGAPASEFDGMEGDILIAQELPGILWHVYWDGDNFQTEQLAQVSQWEHVTFSTAGIVQIAPIDVCDGIDNNGNGIIDEGEVGVDDDGDGIIDEDFEICPPSELNIMKWITLNNTSISIDEMITELKDAQLVEATLIDPNNDVYVYHSIPKTLPAVIGWDEPKWTPHIQFFDGEWQLKMQIIAFYENPETNEIKEMEQKIIINFQIINNNITTENNEPLELHKEIIINPHPAQLNGAVDITIGETVMPSLNNAFVVELTIAKPSGTVVSYTNLPIDITSNAITIPFPDDDWNSLGANPTVALDEVGLYELDIEIVAFYDDGTVGIHKINQKLWISFNVLPEAAIGAIGLIGASIAVFAVFAYRKQKINH